MIKVEEYIHIEGKSFNDMISKMKEKGFTIADAGYTGRGGIKDNETLSVYDKNTKKYVSGTIHYDKKSIKASIDIDTLNSALEEYIPDMTERYPEGMRSYIDDDDSLDYIPDEITLEEAVREYMNDSSYYNRVRVVGCDGQTLLETNKLEDVLKMDEYYLQALIYDCFWHDADIMFKLYDAC